VKAFEQRTRQSQVKTCVDQALQRAETEPADVDLLRALAGQQTCARRLTVAVVADRQQESDRLVPQPARREPKRERRRSVEPLKIVNRYYHPGEPYQVLLTEADDQALGRLARLIPRDVVTANVPANGSAFLYAFHNRPVLFESLLLDPDPDHALIGEHLREAATRPDVCDALRREGVVLSGPVELAALVDEEEHGLGIRRFVAHREIADRENGSGGAYAACVVAEPTDLQTIIAARGDAYLDIVVHGSAAHSGRPDDGRNAIYGAAAVIASLQRWHEELTHAAHPLVGPPTWSVGLVAGGQGVSTVPAVCRIGADRRLLPGESAAQVLAELRDRVAELGLERQGLRVEVAMSMDMPGFETPSDHPVVVGTDAALRAAGGPRLPLGGWTAACDGGFVARDLGVPTVVLGPGSVNDQAHRADESVGVAELVVAARAYALTALRLLG